MDEVFTSMCTDLLEVIVVDGELLIISFFVSLQNDALKKLS